jgi:hypothetical protein
MRYSADTPKRARLLDSEERALSMGGRKPYSPPQLIAWGTLLELTRGGAGGALDFDFVSTKAF